MHDRSALVITIMNNRMAIIIPRIDELHIRPRSDVEPRIGQTPLVLIRRRLATAASTKDNQDKVMKGSRVTYG